MPVPVLAETAEIMSDIDQQGRVVFAAEVLHGSKIRRVRIHREQTFGHDHDRVFGVLGAHRAQPATAMIQIEVAELIDVLRRGVRTFLQACMREAIHHDVVGRADQTLDGAKAGRPARRVEEDLVHLQEVADPAFERN